MLENLKGLKIQGGCFKDEEELVFFDKKEQRFSLVFGRNGSGKSTIAKAFRSVTEDDSLQITGKMTAFDGTELTPSSIGTEICKTYVFDEQYIDSHVRIAESGLQAIVLLGQQVGIETEIKDVTSKIGPAVIAAEQAKQNLDEYLDAKSTKSPQFHYKDIEKKLKVDGGWAAIDSLIKGNTVKSSVNSTLIAELLSLSVPEGIDELATEFQSKLELLEKSKGIETASIPTVPEVSSYETMEKRVLELLAKQIVRSELTEREKAIFDTVLKIGAGRVEEIRDVFSDETTEHCPYCFQPVSREYKKILTDAIDKVLNKEADEHKSELASHLPTIAISVSQFISIDPKTVALIQGGIDNCNELISQYNNALERKSENIYSPITMESLGLENEIQKLIKLLAVLKQRRTELLSAANGRKKLVAELILLNKRIAAKKLRAEFKTYSKQITEQKKAEEEYKKQNKAQEDLVKRKEELEAQKNNISIAIDTINSALQYVFFSKDRLSIQLVDGSYCLKSNGQDVLPRNVSVGERNIVALCYFFTEIMQMKAVEDFYKQEMLIVIDDPVSSFDFDNRVGIVSFLKAQFLSIMLGNNSSKVIVLSHDLATIYDVEKAMNEVGKVTAARAHVEKSESVKKELRSQALYSLKMKPGEYSRLMENIYRYAMGEQVQEYDVNIGNTMRRVLEAFSTFLYKKSIEDISVDSGVLKILEPKSKYFECLMYRLVLHGESHYEEQVYSLTDDMHFYDHLSVVEKQKTARDVLCMMYLLQKMHVRANLQAISNSEKQIIEWCDNIPND